MNLAGQRQSNDVTPKPSKRKNNKKNIEINARKSAEDFLARANYELKVDSYRGIFDNDHSSPFEVCSNVLMEEIQSSSGTLIRCPCANGWMIEELYKRESTLLRSTKKKKKRRSSIHKKTTQALKENDGSKEVEIVNIEAAKDAGSSGNDNNENNSTNGEKIDAFHNIYNDLSRRNPDKNFACSCDFNPFCLASMGGVVDHVLNMKITNSFENDKESVEYEYTSLPESSSSSFDDQLRGVVHVDTDSVTQHLLLLGIAKKKTKKYIDFIRKTNLERVYEGNRQTDEGGKLALCKPVGIRNLGATCYLNSQLQCLAANLPFLEGLFSWQSETNNSSVMSNVISRLQEVLVTMTHGAKSVVCTDEFSKSMQLENDEMQDPNEFARLLFDRMHDSFQQTPLQQLLSTIFKGTLSYRTQCQRCNNVTTRDEDIMDLNIPIKTDSNNSREITLEDLLEQYFQPESLTGDNKYRCEVCQDACDAKRSHFLSELPLVLNLQLARYIFDMKNFRKQKILSKILLPKSLELDVKGTCNVKYILCAIQNHKGGSAHTGHYIAEVMDWSTGSWYEFDDDKVSFLEYGPKSTYDPIEARESKVKLKGGTPDAYNLFYVQESCLREGIEKTLCTGLKETGIVSEKMQERNDVFKKRKEEQLMKKEIDTRLKIRKRSIMESFFSDKAMNGEKTIWVEGSTLRRFLSCDDGMEDIIGNANGPILKHNMFICKHGKGIHPDVSNGGKLLTELQFQSYCHILHSEKLEINKNSTDPHLGTGYENIYDIKISTNSNLYCSECDKDHRNEIESKVDRFRLFIDLYDQLGNYAFSHFNNDQIFAISRSSASALRKFALKVLKTSLQVNGCNKDEIPFIPIKGIHSLSPELLSPVNISYEQQGKTEEIDEKVNSKIICDHGHCEKINNKRTIRFVSSKTWCCISSLLPEAVSIPVSKDENGNLLSCQDCNHQKQEIENALDRISIWAEHGTSILNKISSMSYKSNTSEEYVFVHSHDIEAWGKAVKHFKKKRKKRQSSKETLKLEVLEIFCRPGTETTSICPFQLTCKVHKKPIASIKAFADILPSTGTEIDPKTLLDLPLTQLPRDVHKEYCTSMTRLEDIIFRATEIELERFRVFQQSHPRATSKYDSADFTKSAPQNLHLVHNVCNEASCISEYRLYFEREMQCAEDLTSNEERDDKEDVVGNTSVHDTESMRIMVYEFDGSSDDDSSKRSLLKQFDNELEGSSTITSPFRRSTRSRTGVNGRLFEISCGRDINLAQLRLLIAEKSNNKCLTTQDLDIFQYKSETQEIVTFHLSDDMNDREIPDILNNCETLSISNQEKLYVRLLAKSNIVDIDDEDTDEAEYIAHLLQIATACDSPVSSSVLTNAKKSKSRRRQERGFQGTFLQSAFHPLVNDSDSCVDSDEVIIVDPEVEEVQKSSQTDVKEGIQSKSRVVPQKDDLSSLPNIPLCEDGDVSNDTRGPGCGGNQKEVNLKCFYIQIFSYVYESSRASFDFKGKKPPIPSDPIPSEHTLADIQIIVSNACEGEDCKVVAAALTCEPKIWHLFRNFGLDQRFWGNQGLNYESELYLSRHEMDVILYGIKHNWPSAECHKLMPYRHESSVRHMMKSLKKEGITTNEKYEAYMLYVDEYLKVLDNALSLPTDSVKEDCNRAKKAKHESSKNHESIIVDVGVATNEPIESEISSEVILVENGAPITLKNEDMSANGTKRKEPYTSNSKTKRAKTQSLNGYTKKTLEKEEGSQTKSKKNKVPEEAMGNGSKRVVTHTDSTFN
ncbi:hypothetical protein CTEN210_08609 [Chaetoceros tenuissimus]|uniref:ubiquitinyl hydrolase 1 n=1 Tax=Chaetoceros tenuissimus TaxID=426638 RepID=A0AAD3CU19_9STRA|nr:hypothetical protein CTEN210_08609 [Chaetoceros tenuissimus]